MPATLPIRDIAAGRLPVSRHCARALLAAWVVWVAAATGLPARAQVAGGPPVGQALPGSPLDPDVAGQQVQQAIERSYLRCRTGGAMTVDLLHLDQATSTAPADAAWIVKVTFAAASAGTATRPLAPGECGYLDRPPPSEKAVVLWRPLRTGGTPAERKPTDGLRSVTTSQQWGYLYTTSVDPVFDSVFDALFRRGAPGASVSFRLRAEPLGCARNCSGFAPQPWDFHVLEILPR